MKLPTSLRHIALVYCAFSALSALAACPLPDTALRVGSVQAVWQTKPAPIQNGKLFTLDVQLCPADVKLMKVDATMPEHQHGMNYRPSIKHLAHGNWRAEGLMFHMPGTWELKLDVQTAEGKLSLRDTIQLP